MATTKKSATKLVQFLGTGRRKTSVARVRLLPNGKGNFVINKEPIDEYFRFDTLKTIARQALAVTGTEKDFDIFVNVQGGGDSGQAGAIRHGVARALVAYDEKYKAALKEAGYLTRDPRMKERKKYGLKKARKAPQFSKR